MKPLTYTFVETPGQKHVELVAAAADTLTAPGWQTLAESIAQEASLTAYPAPVLARRWQQGYAAVAIEADEIVSYTSVVPVFSETSRPQLAALIGVEAGRMPAVDLFEFATGWTRPDCRRKGISLQLRQKLLERFSRPNCLHISISIGLGASPILERLGWQLVGWSKIPFVTSLIGVPTAGLEDKIGLGWSPPPELKRYEGEHLSPRQDTAHPWTEFCHFWVSNPALASELDRQLSTLVEAELRRWREAVVTVLTVPSEFGWKLILFKD